jgi:hypothetical protein
VTWVKLDDRVMSHPKIHDAGPEAFSLWVAMLCHSNAHHTDGRVPSRLLSVLFPGQFSAKKLRKLAKTLTEVGLVYFENDVYILHDYDDFQGEATQAAVEAKREKARKRQAKKRERERREKDVSHRDGGVTSRRDKSVSHGGVTPPRPVPAPSRPKTHTEGVTVSRRKLHSSLAAVPHPNDPTKTYSSAQYVVEAFRAIARTIGQDITPSAIRHKERAALELIETLALESISHIEVGREAAFAEVVNQRMNRYRDAHKESPQKTPWKASWIAERWPALGAAA